MWPHDDDDDDGNTRHNVVTCSTFATQPPAGPGAAVVAAPTPHLQPLANQRVQEKLLRMI